MAKHRIFTIGFELPGDEFERVEFNSDRTLLDADIILFEPTLGDVYSVERYSGKQLLTEHSSSSTKEQLDHWRSEIVAAINAGKLVIVYLSKPVECFRHTGRREFSGTGRSRVTTNIVEPVSSYDSVPNLRTATAKSGKEMRLEKGGSFLAPYWSEFSTYSPYEVEIEGDFKEVLLKSRTGDRIVGAAVRGKGTLLFLPPLRYEAEKFVRYDAKSEESYWTEEAERFAKRLVAALGGLADNPSARAGGTPPPPWTMESRYRLAEESRLQAAVSVCTSKIAELQSKKVALETQLGGAGTLRRLLFEQGLGLEAAILEALTLFGFEAKPFASGGSEFDAVFVSPEGRCLGEAEGKDTKPINIDKFSQLERNLQEDFARDDVEDYAKGVLFGNAYRLQPLNERKDYFTDKCVSAAKRVKVALVRTPDLFGPARYLKENPTDVAYAAECRKAIFATEGAIVSFPVPPVGDATSVTEGPPSGDSSKPGINVNDA